MAKHNELKLEQGQHAEDHSCLSIDMLGTIKLPNNMKLMQNNLPSSNYKTDRPKKKKQDEIKILDQIKEEPETNRDHYVSSSQPVKENKP